MTTTRYAIIGDSEKTCPNCCASLFNGIRLWPPSVVRIRRAMVLHGIWMRRCNYCFSMPSNRPYTEQETDNSSKTNKILAKFRERGGAPYHHDIRRGHG